jgi:hypothetical protein
LPLRSTMDALVQRSIAGDTGLTSSASVFALYIRSHWLRMPPLRLVQHLARKSFRRKPSSPATP